MQKLSDWIKNDMYAYRAVHDFLPVEEVALLADGPTGCGEVQGVGIYFPTVLAEAERRTRPNMTPLLR
jgi:hypothetical protein